MICDLLRSHLQSRDEYRGHGNQQVDPGQPLDGNIREKQGVSGGLKQRMATHQAEQRHERSLFQAALFSLTSVVLTVHPRSMPFSPSSRAYSRFAILLISQP